MNQELKQVNLWLTANKVSLKFNKTQFMIFKSQKKKLAHGEKVIINEHPVKEVNYTKFLGLHIDENLYWKYHISHVTMKMSKITGILANARHYLPLKTLQTLYMMMIYPLVFNILLHLLGKYLSY